MMKFNRKKPVFTSKKDEEKRKNMMTGKLGRKEIAKHIHVELEGRPVKEVKKY